MSAATMGTRGDCPSFGLLLCTRTWYHHLLYISTFSCCVCYGPSVYEVCWETSILTRYRMRHYLGIPCVSALACGVQNVGAWTTAWFVVWMEYLSVYRCYAWSYFVILHVSLELCGQVVDVVYRSLVFLCLCAATLLLIAGGGIPTSRCKLSILLGCRHPVMERHASFNIGLTLCVCANLSHTGHAYSAVE